MLNRIAQYCLILTFVSGCSAFPSPSDENASAIVGKMTVTFDKRWRIFHSGVHQSGIEVRLINLGTGEVDTAFTDRDGIYSFTNIQPGFYSINSWSISESDNSENWVISGNVDSNRVAVGPGKLTFSPEVVEKVTVLSNSDFSFSFGSEIRKAEQGELLDYVENTNASWVSFID